MTAQILDRSTTPAPSADLHTAIYTQADAVPARVWTKIAAHGGHAVFLQQAYLRAMESAPGITPRYAVLWRDQRPLAFALLQAFRIDPADLRALEAGAGAPLKERVKKRALGTTLSWLDLKVLLVGNAYLSNSDGVWADPKLSQPALGRWLDRLTRDRAAAPFRPSLLLIKDPPIPTLGERLTPRGYLEIDIDPIMTLHLRPEWKTPADYAAALSARYRRDMRKARAKGERLRRSILDARAIARAEGSIMALYEQVLGRADLVPVRKDARTFARLAEELGPDQFSLVGYYLDQRLVAFNTRFHTETELTSHFFGMDYEVGRDVELYRNLLYDDLEDGIRLGAERVCYGRGAHQIKSALGAVPERISSFGRHRWALATRRLAPTVAGLQAAEWPERHPFKQAA